MTPNFSKSRCARNELCGDIAGSKRGPASMSATRIPRAARELSKVSGPRINSAIAPAISTPVGPPPITLIVNSCVDPFGNRSL